jgi:hypothetical protein
MKIRLKALTLPLVALIFASCSKDEVVNQTAASLTIPTFYDSLEFMQNTQTQVLAKANFDYIVAEVKKGRTVTNSVSAQNMLNAFESGNPSLASVTTSFYSNMLKGSNGWFEVAKNVSRKTYHPDSTMNVGGVYISYLFDKNGAEPEQMIEKGLFGAALANQTFALISNNPTLESVDKAIDLIGATPHFKNSGNTIYGSAADKYLANYIARRDKNDGKGFYSLLKFNFIKLRAAIKAGSAFDKEKQEAIGAIKLICEQANFATVVNYCHASIANLSKTTLNDTIKSSTLHALSECIGFTMGWKTVSGKKITDTQIDEILTLLNAPTNDNIKPVLFLTDRINQIGKLQEIITKVKNIYGFSNEQIEDFKKNWVAEQKR